MDDRDFWFPLKTYGWGWGLPVAWQGWVVLAVYAVTLALLAHWFPPQAQSRVFYAGALLATVALVAIVWLKGERH